MGVPLARAKPLFREARATSTTAALTAGGSPRALPAVGSGGGESGRKYVVGAPEGIWDAVKRRRSNATRARSRWATRGVVEPSLARTTQRLTGASRA